MTIKNFIPLFISTAFYTVNAMEQDKPLNPFPVSLKRNFSEAISLSENVKRKNPLTLKKSKLFEDSKPICLAAGEDKTLHSELTAHFAAQSSEFLLNLIYGHFEGSRVLPCELLVKIFARMKVDNAVQFWDTILQNYKGEKREEIRNLLLEAWQHMRVSAKELAKYRFTQEQVINGPFSRLDLSPSEGGDYFVGLLKCSDTTIKSIKLYPDGRDFDDSVEELINFVGKDSIVTSLHIPGRLTKQRLFIDLLKSLQENPVIKSFGFQLWRYDKEISKHLIALFRKNSNLRSFEINQEGNTDYSYAKLFRELSHCSSLKKLKFFGGLFDDKDSQHLSHLIENKDDLTSLILSECTAPRSVLESIVARLIQNKPLESVVFDCGDMRVDDLSLLIEGLNQNMTLKSLKLVNVVDDLIPEFTNLFRALENNLSLKVFGCDAPCSRDNNFNLSALAAMIEANKGLEKLYLEIGGIEEEEQDLLCQALKNNTTLREIIFVGPDDDFDLTLYKGIRRTLSVGQMEVIDYKGK